ncbi:hypothetical protein VPH35_082555 [Triticum aestivum]
MEIGRRGLCNSGDTALKLFGSTVSVEMEQRGAAGSRDDAAVKPRRSCNEASPDASVLRWSSTVGIDARCIAAPATSRPLHLTSGSRCIAAPTTPAAAASQLRRHRRLLHSRSSGIDNRCIAALAVSQPLQCNSGGVDERCIAALVASMPAASQLQWSLHYSSGVVDARSITAPTVELIEKLVMGGNDKEIKEVASD